MALVAMRNQRASNAGNAVRCETADGGSYGIATAVSGGSVLTMPVAERGSDFRASQKVVNLAAALVVIGG